MNFLFLVFIVWRFLLFLVAFVGAKILAFTPSFPYSEVLLLSSKLPSWFWNFANFDGVHYLTIASSGYAAQFTQVFFPLFPLLIRLIHFLIPFLHPIVIGLLISNSLLFFTLFFFWKLLIIDYKKEIVEWAILFLIFFPTSFFLGSLYTESLFLFLVIVAFYAARKKHWFLSGIFGGLASATRLVGIFLLPALIWEWQVQNKKVFSLSKKEKKSSSLREFIFSLFSQIFPPFLYLIPLGLIIYMAYLQLKFGDWLYFWHVQPIFGAERSGGGIILLPQVIWRYGKILVSLPSSTYQFKIAFFEIVSTIFALICMILSHKEGIRTSYLIFSWFALITPTLTGTFSSMPRYILVIFPIYIVLAKLRIRTLKTIILFIFFLLLLISTLMFTRGFWIG